MQTTLIYMVAGLSSRFGGKAKQLAKVGPNGETLLEYSIKQALPAGITKIILIVSEKTKDLFKDEFGDNYNGVPVQYALQTHDQKERDKPWGTVDALCSAKNLIDSNFIVCNGDDLYGQEAFKILTDHFRRNKNCAAIGYQLGSVCPQEGSVNRGIYKIDSQNKILSLEENFNIELNNLKNGLTPESLCSMNIFALTPQALEQLNNKLLDFKEKNKEDKKIECLLPQEISGLIKENKISMSLYPTSSKWYGVTNPEDEQKVRDQLKNS